MAGATPTFEQFFDRTPVSQPDPTPQEVTRWNSWESWVTFTIILFVQLPVVGSLQTANWVAEMPSLMAAALAGLLTAWVLGHTRVTGAVAGGIASAVGAVTVTGLVLHTMRLVDPSESGLWARWGEFRMRLLEWVRAVFGDGISTDPLPFVVLLVGIVFLVAFVSTWAVVRWRNPWIALIPGGIVLLTNISYLPGQPSFSFILFLIAAILLITRLTFVDASIGWRRQGMHPNEGMSIEVLLVGAAVATALILAAWTIPTANNWGPVADAWGRALAPVSDRVDRLGQLFVGVGSKKPIPVHSMGAVLPIQGRVTLDQDPLYEVAAPEGTLLRGAVYDEYTGSGWRVNPAGAVTLAGTSVEAAQLGTAASRASLQEAVRVDVTVLHESAPTDVLLGAGDPIASDQEGDLLIDRAGGSLQLRPASTIGEGTSYTTVATRSVATAETLQAAGQNYPATIVARYLGLPDGYPPEVQALALSVAGQAASPYDAARLVEGYLRSSHRFSMEIEAPPPGRDAVEHFLFESREGYFDLFASSMAVMMRSIGIPSRVAVGFALDERDFDNTTKTYTVTEQRAWAWPEVYFPGLGWVEFNPTPTRSIPIRPGDDSAARAAASQFDGFGGEDFDGGLFGDAGEEFYLDDFIPGGSAATGVGDEAGDVWLARIIGWLLVGATVALIAVLGIRLLWERAFRGLDVRARRWAKLLWFAGIAGLHADPHRTPAETAHDLGSRTGEPDAWRTIARAYTHVRYGGPTASPESEEEATAQSDQYRRLRGVLVRMALRRLSRFGRVAGGPLSGRRSPAGTRTLR